MEIVRVEIPHRHSRRVLVGKPGVSGFVLRDIAVVVAGHAEQTHYGHFRGFVGDEKSRSAVELRVGRTDFQRVVGRSGIVGNSDGNDSIVAAVEHAYERIFGRAYRRDSGLERAHIDFFLNDEMTLRQTVVKVGIHIEVTEILKPRKVI